MIDDTRLGAIAASPEEATPDEVAALAEEAQRWRPVNRFVHESLKAIYINAKEEETRSLVLDVVTDIARTCMRRMKAATYKKK